MNKIGFRIYRFKEGPSVGLTVNEGDWTRKVVDIRDILKLYNSEDETKFAMFMSFSKTGSYITIARAISGRGGDNTAAWIFIPNTIEVLGEEIISIVKVVKEELSASKSNEDRLTELFSRNYRTVEAADFMPSSSEKVYAKRNVGFYPLIDLIGGKRYQPIYSKYNAILVCDKEDTMEIVDKNVVDLTDEQMVETLVFCPPVKQDIPFGVTVHFDAPGQPLFNKPKLVNKSDHIKLLFKRDRFESIPYMDSVEENGQICSVPPSFDWKLSISRDMFKVRAAHNREIILTEKSRIYLNGEELMGNRVVLLPEKDAGKASITISADGYETFEQKVNLRDAKNLIVDLHRPELSQKWNVELSNGHFAEMTLKSKYLPQNYSGSPLKGYSIGIASNRLEYTNFGVIKQRAIGFAIAVATGLIICLCVGLYEWYDSHRFTWQWGWPPLKTEKISNLTYYSQAEEYEGEILNNVQNPNESESVSGASTTIEDAIKYLDDNETWEKGSLDHYPELDGLFDEMNDYDFDMIQKRKSILGNSKNFKSLIDAIQLNKEKPSGKYLNEGVLSIDISDYIKKLNSHIEQAKTPVAGGVASDDAREAAKNTKIATPDKSSKSSKNKSKRGNTL